MKEQFIVKSRRPRCAPQYALIDPKLIEVTILPQSAQGSVRCFAELRDISRVSVTVLCTGQPELQPGCRISLASPKFDGVLVVPVEVNWVRPNPAGDWLVGCQIDPPLSSAYLKKLLSSGLLVRRSAPREPTRIPVQVQMQSEGPRLPALVRDISTGGLCLATSRTPETTRHICIFASTPEREVQIQLEVCWSMRAERECFVGCKFVQPADYAELRKVRPTTEDRPRNWLEGESACKPTLPQNRCPEIALEQAAAE
jgi:hypothetical protein